MPRSFEPTPEERAAVRTFESDLIATYPGRLHSDLRALALAIFKGETGTMERALDTNPDLNINVQVRYHGRQTPLVMVALQQGLEITADILIKRYHANPLICDSRGQCAADIIGENSSTKAKTTSTPLLSSVAASTAFPKGPLALPPCPEDKENGENSPPTTPKRQSGKDKTPPALASIRKSRARTAHRHSAPVLPLQETQAALAKAATQTRPKAYTL